MATRGAALFKIMATRVMAGLQQQWQQQTKASELPKLAIQLMHPVEVERPHLHPSLRHPAALESRPALLISLSDNKPRDPRHLELSPFEQLTCEGRRAPNSGSSLVGEINFPNTI